MFKFSMLLAVLLVVFAFGCTDQANSAGEENATDGNGESVEPTETSDAGDNAATANDAVTGDFNYTPPEVGQWIAYSVEGEESEFELAIVAEEEYQGANCLWYQIVVEDEAVAQVLIDPALMAELVILGDVYMQELIADPVACIEEYMPEDGSYLTNEEAIENMMLLLNAIKQVKVNDGTQLMLLDMAGVPELVEQMIAENPEMLEQSMEMNPTEDPEFQEFMTKLETAEFSLEEVEIDGLACLQFNATHPEKGTIFFAVSEELPILPLMEATVLPNDPEEEGGSVYVSGFGYEGAENLMTGAPDQTIPLAMMLQGLASQMTPPTQQ